MLRILCTGDSHTWGQGADGLEKEFDPPWVGGELRLASFKSGCYVNRLRNMVNEATGSKSAEWTARELADMSGAEFEAPCAVIDQRSVELEAEGSLFRIEFGMICGESEACIELDGQTVREENLQAEQALNAWRIAAIHAEPGLHRLKIRAERGEVRLFRVEAYSGACAVINSGVGSCPVNRLLSDFWKNYVEAVRPDAVLMEAHTINDWLTGDDPETYFRRLKALIEEVKGIGAVPVLLTVSPIGGEQILPGLAAEYDLFIEASRRAARACSVQLCDANRMMKIMTDGMTEQERFDFLFADNWHPNERGHAVYAQMLFEAISNETWFREMEV